MEGTADWGIIQKVTVRAHKRSTFSQEIIELDRLPVVPGTLWQSTMMDRSFPGDTAEDQALFTILPSGLERNLLWATEWVLMDSPLLTLSCCKIRKSNRSLQAMISPWLWLRTVRYSDGETVLITSSPTLHQFPERLVRSVTSARRSILESRRSNRPSLLPLFFWTTELCTLSVRIMKVFWLPEPTPWSKLMNTWWALPLSTISSTKARKSKISQFQPTVWLFWPKMDKSCTQECQGNTDLSPSLNPEALDLSSLPTIQ